MGDLKQYEPLWGAWYVDSLIGEGSFGKVYKVRREEFGKTYYSAVKIITIPQNEADLRQIRGEGMDDASARSYFHAFVADIIQEIDLMSEFRGNSNIVSFEDHKVIEQSGKIGWDILIRMELLTSLTDHVTEKPLARDEIIKFGVHICRALELCAIKKTIHRDIKPDNIFVSQYGEYKLGDFGIARQIERTAAGLSKKGTYTYMAPEVFKGDEYGSSVDMYSLGIVMYRFLNQNRTPFLPNFPAVIKPSDRDEALQRRMKGEALPPLKGVSSDLNAIILKACAYDRKERFSSPTEMREALEAVAGGKSYAPVSTPIQDTTERERTNGTAGVLDDSTAGARRVEDRTSATEGAFTTIPQSSPYSPYHEATSRTEGVFTSAPKSEHHIVPDTPEKKSRAKAIFALCFIVLGAFFAFATIQASSLREEILMKNSIISAANDLCVQIRDSVQQERAYQNELLQYIDDPATLNTTYAQLETLLAKRGEYESDVQNRFSAWPDYTDYLYQIFNSLANNVSSSVYNAARNGNSDEASNIIAQTASFYDESLALLDVLLSDLDRVEQNLIDKSIWLSIWLQDCMLTCWIGFGLIITGLFVLLIFRVKKRRQSQSHYVYEALLLVLAAVVGVACAVSYAKLPFGGVILTVPDDIIPTAPDITSKPADDSDLSFTVLPDDVFMIEEDYSEPFESDDLAEMGIVMPPMQRFIDGKIGSNDFIINMADYSCVPILTTEYAQRLSPSDLSETVNDFNVKFNDLYGKFSDGGDIANVLLEISEQDYPFFCSVISVIGRVSSVDWRPENNVLNLPIVCNEETATASKTFLIAVVDNNSSSVQYVFYIDAPNNASALTDDVSDMEESSEKEFTPEPPIATSLPTSEPTQTPTPTPEPMPTTSSTPEPTSTPTPAPLPTFEPTPIPIVEPTPTETAPTHITIKGVQYSIDLTSLNLDRAELTDADIEPIKYMTNLKSLSLYYNRISDLTPLQSLTRLTQLNLNLNWEIDDLTPLQSLINLTDLNLECGPYINDITPLSSLTNLNKLRLDFMDSTITDITPLSSLVNLKELVILFAPINDLTPLSSLTKLETLVINGSDENARIRDVTPLSSLTNLTNLAIYLTQVSDFTPLYSLTNLTDLAISGEQITYEHIEGLRNALPNCNLTVPH